MDGRNRHGKHVSAACNACRLRKAKCSGKTQGRCSSCATHGEKCEFDKDDGRRTISKEEAKSLRLMNKNLSTELARLTARLRDYEDGQRSQPSLSIAIPEHQTSQTPSVYGSSNYPPPTFHSPTVAQSPASAETAASGLSFGIAADLFMHSASPTSTMPSSVGSPDKLFSYDHIVQLFASHKKQNLSTINGDRFTALPGSSPCAYALTTPGLSDISPSVLEQVQKTEDFEDHIVWTVAMPPPNSPYFHVLSTHLPTSLAAIFTYDTHNAFLQAYFDKRVSWSFPECIFWRDMTTFLQHSPGVEGRRSFFFSPSLHVAVILEASVHANSLLNERDELATHARALAEMECTAIDSVVPAIHALLIIAKYYVAKGCEHIGFGILATAYQAACKNGLNLHAHYFGDSERRWAYASCYMSLFIQDIELALHAGVDPSVAPPTKELLEITPPSGFVSDMEWKCFTLAVQLSGIIRQIALIDVSHGRPAVEALQCNDSLLTWSEKIPNSAQVLASPDAPTHFLVLIMMHQWAIICVHRLLYVYGETGPNYQTIEDAEKKLLRVLKQFKERRGGVSDPGVPFALVQITFIAGVSALVRLSTLSSGAQRAQRAIKENVETARDALHDMAVTWPCAGPFGDILAARITPGSSSAISISQSISGDHIYQESPWINSSHSVMSGVAGEWQQPELFQQSLYQMNVEFFDFNTVQDTNITEGTFFANCED